MPNIYAAIPLSEAGMTVLIGLVVVFSTLIVLTFIFWLFGRATGGNKPSSSAAVTPSAPSAPPAPKTAPKAAPTAAPKAAAAPAPVANGVDPAVVAAISAAIACMAPAGTQYVLRSVRPSRVQRPAWAQAGLAEATRPF